MKKRYIQDKSGRLVEVTSVPAHTRLAPDIMRDIAPYQSMIDGSMITSRSRHREHLRAHGCEEVGNDSSLFHEPKPLKSPPGLKEELIRAAHKHLRSK